MEKSKNSLTCSHTRHKFSLLLTLPHGDGGVWEAEVKSPDRQKGDWGPDRPALLDLLVSSLPSSLIHSLTCSRTHLRLTLLLTLPHGDGGVWEAEVTSPVRQKGVWGPDRPALLDLFFSFLLPPLLHSLTCSHAHLTRTLLLTLAHITTDTNANITITNVLLIKLKLLH